MRRLQCLALVKGTFVVAMSRPLRFHGSKHAYLTADTPWAAAQ